uniref:Uncharacterized protein n=2 Tax=Cucumis melo TaxID=3656 RepID=A0A9I9EFL7_CUCME
MVTSMNGGRLSAGDLGGEKRGRGGDDRVISKKKKMRGGGCC